MIIWYRLTISFDLRADMLHNLYQMPISPNAERGHIRAPFEQGETIPVGEFNRSIRWV